MDSPSVSHRPRPDAVPEDEIRTLAEIYRFVLRTHEVNEKGTSPSARDDVRKDLEDAHTAKRIVP